jgi:hypothetical protein
MTDKLDEDDLLDEMLGAHLRSCLDGQLGRSQAAFGRELESRRRLRLWAWAGAAVAASLAVAWLVLGTGRSAAPTQVVHSTQTPPHAEDTVTPVLQAATWSRMMDDGAAVVDGRPVRQLRRNVVEEIEWYDAKDGAVVRTTVPQQQIFYIGMPTD